jgi:tRNA pseudouridine38-40 synthase
LLRLSYDGGAFYGWAKQPEFRTVQEELELALSKVLPGAWGKPVPTVVAGRTDTGVHAREQFVHFDHPVGEPPAPHADKLIPADIIYRLRCVLPDDIGVHSLQQVDDAFSARFWARSRTYRDRICDSPEQFDPLRRADVFYCRSKLDVRRMKRAVSGFTGLHDFAAFVKPRKGATSIRDLKRFRFRRPRWGRDKGLVVAELKADAFAYNMVRSLVGAAVLVGQGKRDVGWMRTALSTGTREGATGPIAAKGLTLEHISYIKNPRRAAQRAGRIRATR